MGNTVHQPHKSSLGIDANLMAVASCLPIILLLFAFLGVFASVVALLIALAIPLIIYFLEKNSLLVKFTAAQATVVTLVCGLIVVVLLVIRSIVYKAIIKNITYDIYTSYWNYSEQYDNARTVRVIFLVIIYLVVLAFIGLQVIVALKSFKFTQFKLPVIGGIAEKVAEKLNKVNIGTPGANVPPAQGYTPPPAQQWTPPPAQQWTPPAQGYTPPPAQPYTPPAPPPAQPMFDTQTGQPLAPLPPPPPAAPPAQPKFDTETGLPINPTQE